MVIRAVEKFLFGLGLIQSNTSICWSKGRDLYWFNDGLCTRAWVEDDLVHIQTFNNTESYRIYDKSFRSTDIYYSDPDFSEKVKEALK